MGEEREGGPGRARFHEGWETVIMIHHLFDAPEVLKALARILFTAIVKELVLATRFWLTEYNYVKGLSIIGPYFRSK